METGNENMEPSTLAVFGVAGTVGELSKPITKLIETVGAGVGAWYEPIGIRRRGRAEADVIEMTAHANAKAADIAQRSAIRLENRERRRQRNIEKGARGAVEFLPGSVSDEPVDEDWVQKWMQGIEDVSNERMQIIWSKILAGETGKPGSFSQKTLSIMKTIDEPAANLFTKLCRFAWQLSDEKPQFFVPHVKSFAVSDGFMDFRILGTPDHALNEVSYAQRLHLESLGLLKTDPSGLKISGMLRPGTSETYYYHGQELRVWTEGQPRKLEFMVDLLTPAGNELFRICGAEHHIAFRDEFVAALRHQGLLVEWD
jgi:hypothetical protein